eukprot:20949-Heterococcus_DN1.PRE.1
MYTFGLLASSCALYTPVSTITTTTAAVATAAAVLAMYLLSVVPQCAEMAPYIKSLLQSRRQFLANLYSSGRALLDVMRYKYKSMHNVNQQNVNVKLTTSCMLVQRITSSSEANHYDASDTM